MTMLYLTVCVSMVSAYAAGFASASQDTEIAVVFAIVATASAAFLLTAVG